MHGIMRLINYCKGSSEMFKKIIQYAIIDIFEKQRFLYTNWLISLFCA